MIKFLFLISTVFANAQQKAVSPFSIEEYKNMKNEYSKITLEKKDQLLYLQNKYYSTQKIDSLLLIKDQIKRQYWIDNGKKNEEITEKELRLVNDEILLPYAIFKIKNNGNEFYCINSDYSSELFIETIKGKSINFTFNEDGYIEGIQDRISKFTTGNYYYLNNQLKRTSTLFNNSQNVGIFQEYDRSGKLTNEIDWLKDFPISEKQAASIARKEILIFLANKYKDYSEIITEFKKSNIRIYKNLHEEKRPVWLFKYNAIKGIIDAKTGKLLKIIEEITIG